MSVLGQEYLAMPAPPRFGPIFSTIAYWLIWNESFFHIVEAAGVSTEGWPDELPKKVVDEYFKLRESNGHKYAQWKLQTAGEVLEREIIPDFNLEDAGFVRGAYHEALEKHRAHRLQVELSRDPKRAKELIESFQIQEGASLEAKPLADWLKEYAGEYEATRGQRSKARAIPGYPGISSMIGGFNPGRLTIILADTGFGKTNFGINLATGAATTMRTLYVNMEMIPYDFTQRVLTSISGLERQPTDLDAKSQFESAIAQNLFITPGQDYSMPELRGLIKRYARSYGVEIVVIDYDQKLKLAMQRGEQEWQALHRALVAIEDIAKSQRLQICVLAQTNEEGRISGSRRALFPASAVLRFYQHETLGPVIEAVKNRFGARGASFKVDYDPRRCLVREERPLTLGASKPSVRSMFHETA